MRFVVRAVDRERNFGRLRNRRRCGSKHSEDDGEIVPLRSDFPAAAEAANFGKTIAQVSPRSYFRRDLQDLLQTLAPSQVAAR